MSEGLEASFRAVADLLETGRRFLVTSHRNPDGDALGSALGVALALEARGKETLVVMRDGWSSAYSGLPGIGRVAMASALPADWPGGFDALLALECPSADRTGWPNQLEGRVVNVDHHPGNTQWGELNLVVPEAAAVGEIVADLLDLLGWPLTSAIATNLWVSLVSDTGSFRYVRSCNDVQRCIDCWRNDGASCVIAVDTDPSGCIDDRVTITPTEPDLIVMKGQKTRRSHCSIAD